MSYMLHLELPKNTLIFLNIHAALVILTQLVSCFTGPNALKSWLDFDKT